MSKYDRRDYKKDKSPPSSDDWTKAPSKKNTKKWCKGVVGRNHVEILVEDSWYSSKLFTCSNRAEAFPWTNIENTKMRWFCIHSKKCAVCGKITRYGLRSEECPVYVSRYGIED